MRRIIAGAAAAVLCTGLAACGGQSDAEDEVTLQVFAAASLTDTFTELKTSFEAENDGVTVEFNFAGSSDLVAQMEQGAPADVFASADENNMSKAVEDDLIDGEPDLFAANTLQIVTPPDNPAGIETLTDLTRDDVQLVVCAAEVPCGAATQTVAETAGLTFEPVSEESAVTDVLGKVVAGEADAGLVYVTDAIGAGDTVEAIDFPESNAVINLYPIAVTARTEQAEAARAFVDYINGPEGRAVLDAAGFLDPA